MAERRFLTFRVAERLYALPAEAVTEVIRMPAFARVPQAPAALLGLAALRGAVLPIASARRLLHEEWEGEGAGPGAETARAIVLSGAAPMALAVDRVESLATAAGGQAEVATILDIDTLLQSAFVRTPPAAPARAAAPAPAAGRPAAAAAAPLRLVTFELAGQEFALPLAEVREIIPAPDSAAAALRSEAVMLGVAAYRDTLLPLVSLVSLVGLAADPRPRDGRRVLVMAFGAALAGLLVDRVLAIVAADPALIEPTPPLILARSQGESRIAAIYRGEGGRRLISILSRDQIFREDVMRRLGETGAPATAATAASAGPGATLRFLVFRLGDDEFGLPIDAVEEVARAPDRITRVPRTPGFLEGVINLRGEVLAVVDQRRRFDMPPAADREARRMIVVRTPAHRAGLIVDSVSEVLRSSADDLQPAPDLVGHGASLVEGVINLAGAGRIVLVLNPGELLTRAERGVLEAFEADMRQGPP
jgi:purine-binding chemotaxis protein CheW